MNKTTTNTQTHTTQRQHTQQHSRNNIFRRQTCATSFYAFQYMASTCIVSGFVFDIAFLHAKTDIGNGRKNKRTNTVNKKQEHTKTTHKNKISKT